MGELTEKYMLIVLRAASKGNRPEADLGEEYRKALETLGLVKFGWDVELTDFGKVVLSHLESRNGQDWGS